MRSTLTLAWLLVVVAGSAACGPILGSAGGRLPASGGSAYSLPKALLKVKLSDRDGELAITVSEPEYVADEKAMYLLQYKMSALANDTVEITIDPKAHLLQTVSGTAEDKTGQIIVALAKAATMIAQAGAGAPEEVVILERKIDPATEPVGLEAEMNRVAHAHVTAMYERKQCSDTAKGKEAPCPAYERLKREPPRIGFRITKPAALAVEPADCSIGVCYRVAAPYGIEFDFNGRYVYGTVVNLPNEQPALVMPLARTMFVKRVNNAEFENGLLKKAHVEKPSEALEIASLPVNVMSAIFSTITSVLQAKIDISDKEKGLAASRTALLQAQKDLADKQIAVAQKGAAVSDGILLSGSSGGRAIQARIPAISHSTTAPQGSGELTSPSNPGQPAPPQGPGAVTGPLPGQPVPGTGR